MKTVFKILKKVVLIGLGVYAALFAVFFFDLARGCSLSHVRAAVRHRAR